MLRQPLAHGHVRGTISKTVLAYCDAKIGTARTDQLAAEVAIAHKITVEQMRSAEAGFSYLVVEDLYPLVVQATHNRDAIYEAGLYSPNMQAIGVFLFGVVRLLGGTKFVYQKTADLTPRFANTGTMRCLEVTDTSALMEFAMFPDLRATQYGFDYRRGLMASTPVAFGKGVARVAVLECQASGDKRDLFRCEW